MFQLSRCGAKICEKQSKPTLRLSFKISPRSRECKPRLNIFLPTGYYSSTSSWFEVLLVESVTVWGGVLVFKPCLLQSLRVDRFPSLLCHVRQPTPKQFGMPQLSFPTNVFPTNM